MKKYNFTYLLCFLLLVSLGVQAGNNDRIGQAGGNELLINPWARQSGMHSINQASARGLEAMRLNVGGLSFTNKTEVMFASTRWLEGSDITLSAFGFSQAVGESGVLGVNIMAMSFGDIDRVTTDSPDTGPGGTFNPSYTNIGIAYSRSFSESIHGGILVRLINHSIADVSASGVAFDTGIQYVTGDNQQIKFGIALRNVGTPMKFEGDGLDLNATITNGDEEGTFSQRPERYELPSLLHIGGAYDFYFGENIRLTAAANFTSNTFRKDFLGGGLEFAFKEMFMLRAGYKYEEGILDPAIGNSALNGMSAGLTVEVPLNSKKVAAAGEDEDISESTFSIDYSYRHTNFYNGVHTLGLRFNL